MFDYPEGRTVQRIVALANQHLTHHCPGVAMGAKDCLVLVDLCRRLRQCLEIQELVPSVRFECDELFDTI